MQVNWHAEKMIRDELSRSRDTFISFLVWTWRMRLLVALASCFCLGLAEQWMPRELGRFKLGNAGFIEVFTEEDGANYLYITTFNPGTVEPIKLWKRKTTVKLKLWSLLLQWTWNDETKQLVHLIWWYSSNL